MKTIGLVGLTVLLGVTLLSGCETTRNITDSFGSSSSSVDENLFDQVPTDGRAGVEKAEIILQIADERAQLAEMKKQLISLQETYAKYDKDAADELRKEAEVGVDLAKWEAIDKENLGDKDKNTDAIADLRAKQLKIEADRVKIEAKRDNVQRQINDLSNQIEEQNTRIINLEAEEKRK
jgi:chromosome segregation ATPase